MSERWLPFDDNYDVSDIGRVRRSSPGNRTHPGRLLTLILQKIGYLSVRPVIEGKNVQFYVHDMVALVFLGPKPDGYVVNHIDGDKQNNHVTNLEYITHAENMAHAAAQGLMRKGVKHPGSKLDPDTVTRIRQLKASGASYGDLAKQFSLSTCTLHKIVHRKAWAHV